MSAGEASGDHYIAALAKTLRHSGYAGDIWGMGGVEARESGIRTAWHGERLQLMGFTEVLHAVPSILALLKEMTDKIIEEAPAAVVVVDSPDYHMRLVSRLRSQGYAGKIFYISPPAVWAWRKSRVHDLRRTIDMCLPLYEFEHDYLVSKGCRSGWIGSPLLEEFAGGEYSKENLPSALSQDGKLVAFLPGSRASEIKHLLPTMEEAASRLKAEGWHPVFSVAPGLDPRVRAKLLERLSAEGIDFYEGSGRDLMATANCAIGASGTITVESLILGCYMIVTYKINKLSALLAKMIIKTPYFAMANILCGSELFPELIQDDANVENMLGCAREWLNGDEKLRAEVMSKMERARKKLGSQGVYKYWAGLLMEAGI